MSANLEQNEIFDAEDNKIGEVSLPPRLKQEPRRTIAYKGKKYIEGGDDGCYYRRNQFSEVTE